MDIDLHEDMESGDGSWMEAASDGGSLRFFAGRRGGTSGSSVRPSAFSSSCARCLAVE